MKTIIKLLCVCWLSILLTSFSAYAVDIFQADRYFQKQQYELARQSYSEAAAVGSPHAYYQLGTIYFKGLGTPQDATKALVWFSLASEYDFNDSHTIVDAIINNTADDQRVFLLEIVDAFKTTFGRSIIEQRYFPVVNDALLNEKITFGGEGTLKNTYQDLDLLLGSFDDALSDLSNPSFDEFEFNSVEDDLFDENGNLLENDQPPSRNAVANFKRRVPFLVVDYDLGPDGSIRNIDEIQTVGYTKNLLELFSQGTAPPPTFQETRISFTNRTYLGQADYGRFQIRAENKPFYERVKRLVRKLKTSTTQRDRYQYALGLLNFKWLRQESGEAERILLELAQEGHPQSQFEYGALLYRSQTDIKQAIHWISESSKFGLPRAQYLLGQILYASPWVIKDEKKALFWFESALQKQHLAATLKSAEIRLLADDTSLHDVPKAIDYLTTIANQQSDNPEYYFLLAVSHKNRENRDFTQVVRYIEQAIRSGQRLNWNVSYWQSLLDKWTTGTVTVTD